MDCFAALAMTAKRTFAASPRNAPEPLAQLILRATETVIASQAKQSILPRKERMDCFAALAMTAKRTFATSRRDAPEPLAQLIPRATETVIASEAKQSILPQ